MPDPNERTYLERARVARLATADADGRPHVVPICYAFDGPDIVSAIDEKPQEVDAMALRRSRDIRTNPAVALVVDHYSEDWSTLAWVQVRGTATHDDPGTDRHRSAVAALRNKYDQYTAHDLEQRPVIRIDPTSTRSWGTLADPETG